MFNLLEYSYLLLLFLVLLIALVIYFKIRFQQLKVLETRRLNLICVEIEAEKKKRKKLLTSPQEILFIKKETQQRLQKIKVDILNINFTLSEVF